MLPLIMCCVLVLLSVLITTFTILDKTEYNLVLNIVKYFGVSINFILALLSLIFITQSITVYSIVCISIMFLVSAGIIALKGIFLRITTVDKYKIYKYICMGCGADQVISIIIFCSQF